MAYELREVEVNGVAIDVREYDVQDKAKAIKYAEKTGGVLYTLYDDENTYARGVFFANRYAYVIFPHDVGEVFEYNAYGRQST